MTETIISLATRQIYDIEVSRNGENQMPCPECSHNRRKKNVKCFSYNVEKEVGYCNHCESRFVKHSPFEGKHYVKPEIQFQNFTKLSDNVVKYFASRGISQRTLIAMKIGEKREYIPQIEKEANCIMFPYYRDSELVNVKYRDGRKNFKLVSGAELIWWNYDAIKKNEEIIIVEGEMDALSCIQSGFENVISVPNGANTGRMEYFDSSFDDLNKVQSFVIATDNDIKGIDLKNDLVRRLGIERCKIANLRQFKDFNEMLTAEGTESVQNAIKTAKFVKVDDVYSVDDFQSDLDSYFENGLPQGARLGIPELDEIIRWQTSRFGVMTGTPQSGKSEFLDFVYARLNSLYGWKYAYYSPESMPLPIHFARVFAKYIGKAYKKSEISENERNMGEDYLNDNVFWVAPNDDMTIDDILSRFEYLVKAKGCKAFIIDPFNRIEQTAEYSNNERLFIKKALVKMSSFTRKTDSLLFLVAHPTKLPKDDKGHFKMPTPYDISGSADFWNMSDYNVSLRRSQDSENGKFLGYGQVAVQKTKINATLGSTGSWNFWYNMNNGRYITDTLDGNRTWDNLNWLTNEEPKLPKINPDEAFSEDSWADELPF